MFSGSPYTVCAHVRRVQVVLTAAVANRLDSPEAVFSDKLEEVNTSNHYTSQPLTTARVNALDRAKMVRFYKARFANAADFRFYMVGAFKIDDALPMIRKFLIRLH